MEPDFEFVPDCGHVDGFWARVLASAADEDYVEGGIDQ